MGEGRHHSAFDGTDGVRKDHRNTYILDCKCRGRCGHDDYIELQAGELGSKFGETARTALGITTLDDKVLALNVAKRSQRLEQTVIETFIAMGEKAHAPDSARLIPEGEQ